MIDELAELFATDNAPFEIQSARRRYWRNPIARLFRSIRCWLMDGHCWIARTGQAASGKIDYDRDWFVFDCRHCERSQAAARPLRETKDAQTSHPERPWK